MLTLAEAQSQTDARLTEAQIRSDTKIVESRERFEPQESWAENVLDIQAPEDDNSESRTP
jgi:hypothetical protein